MSDDSERTRSDTAQRPNAAALHLTDLGQSHSVSNSNDDQQQHDDEKAAKEKEMGNEAFRRGEFHASEQHFSSAIRASPTNAVLFSNRAMALLKLTRYQEAERDCTRAIELEPTYVKAWYRRGVARAALRRYRSACDDLRRSLHLDPGNTASAAQLRRALQNCAIASENGTVQPIDDFPTALKASDETMRDVAVTIIDNRQVDDTRVGDTLSTIFSRDEDRLAHESDDEAPPESKTINDSATQPHAVNGHRSESESIRTEIRAPLSPMDFAASLIRIRDAHDLADYLRKCNPNTYDSLGVALGHAQFSAICRAVATLIDDMEQYATAWRHLAALSRLERIGSLSIALDARDSRRLQTSIRKLAEFAANSGAPDRSSLEAVSAKFSIEL